MKTEHRSIKKFGPALLFRKDLEELEQIITDSVSHPNDLYEVELGIKEKTYKVHSLSELLQQEGLPEKSNKLTVRREGWIERNGENLINRSLDLTMYDNFINCQLFSTDEDWYRGKLSRLELFFKEKRPWYSVLNKLVPYYSLVAMFAFVYFGVLIAIQNYTLSVIPAITGFLLVFFAVEGYRGKLFPYVAIRLSSRPKVKVGLNEIAVLLGMLASFATIVQFVWTL